MRKVISLILALMFCLSFTCTAFASENDEGFVVSPGEIPGDCGHEHTTLAGEEPATCTGVGYTGDLICDDCGKVIEEGEVIPAHGHHFENGVCTICGTDQNNAQTGDESFIFLWIAVMVIAVVGLVAVAVTYRKKFSDR